MVARTPPRSCEVRHPGVIRITSTPGLILGGHCLVLLPFWLQRSCQPSRRQSKGLSNTARTDGRSNPPAFHPIETAPPLFLSNCRLGLWFRTSFTLIPDMSSSGSYAQFLQKLEIQCDSYSNCASRFVGSNARPASRQVLIDLQALWQANEAISVFIYQFLVLFRSASDRA